MADFRFRREYRLRTQAEFDRVYATKAYAADGVLVVNAAASELPFPRLGLSGSRKVGNAVVRNAWKRRIREAFRLRRADLPGGLDLVVRPKLGAKLDYHAIERSLVALVARVHKRLQRDRTS
jgi:ribonuclease P protein component